MIGKVSSKDNVAESASADGLPNRPVAAAGMQEPVRSEREVSPEQKRNPAVDFTKGALVFCMVVYHSVNYMVGGGVDLKYLEFLPPSFIFITGFLIGKVYLAKYRAGGFAVQRRLVVRGVKLLLIFTALNVGAALLFSRNYNARTLAVSGLLDNAVDVYLTGNGTWGIFKVLVPIGYLLIMAAGLLRLCQISKWFVPGLCSAVFVVIGVLGYNGVVFETLNRMSVGILGVWFGYVPERRLADSVRFVYWVAIAYIGYLYAVSVCGFVYWLQVVGACLSVALLYMVGARSGDNVLSRRVIWLGQYSLFAYILQIAVLQVLIRVLPRAGIEQGKLAVAMVATSATIVLAVELLRYLRPRSRTADFSYRVVFG
jgi:peptidoglycan/LPS O-acetylase OafA/YrhL